MVNEKERSLEQGISTLEGIKAQIENMQQQVRAIELSIQEHRRAIETVDGYKNMENDEVLVPVGAGVLIAARVDKKRGMISIGNKLYTEMQIDKIGEKLKLRLDDLEKLRQKMAEDSYKLQENYAILSAKVEDEYKKYLEERGNVQTP